MTAARRESSSQGSSTLHQQKEALPGPRQPPTLTAPDDPIKWAERFSIVERCRAIDLDCTIDMRSRLHRYVSLLMKWNRTYNLTGAKNESTLIEEHLFDCLAVVAPLSKRLDPTNSTLIDIGSGGGLPGLVLAITFPALCLVLVEPIAKKAAFLRQAAALLQTPNVSIAESRMHELQPFLDARGKPPPGQIRHFTSRAFAEMATLVEEARPFATAGSRLFAMKSSRLDAELQALRLPASAVRIHELTVPTIPAPRYLAEVDMDIRPATDAKATEPIDSRSTHWPSR